MGYINIKNRITQNSSSKDKFFNAKTLKELKRSGEQFSKADIQTEIDYLKSLQADSALSNQDQYFLSMALRELEDIDEGSTTTSGGSGGGSVTIVEQNRYTQKIIDSMPAGTIITFSGAILTQGFFPCDGRRLSRSEYSDLFTNIGEMWGAGDGSTTFDIPNLTHSNVSLKYFIKIYTGGLKESQNMIGNIQMMLTLNVPEDFLPCDGRNLLISDYPDCYNVIGRAYSASELQGDMFSLPDFRGMFLRGMSDGRDFGDYQEDQFQKHQHYYMSIHSAYTPAGGGAQSGHGYTRISWSYSAEGDGGTPRVGQETRPKNYPVNYIIRVR